MCELASHKMGHVAQRVAWLASTWLLGVALDEMGNGLCWYNSDRSYERCCAGEGDQTCWKGLWITAELCCYPLTQRHQQCFDSMEARAETKLERLSARQAAEEALGWTSEEPEQLSKMIFYLELLLSQPLSMWSWACSAPSHPFLWSPGCACCDPIEDECNEGDPRLSSTAMTPEHLLCCYPVYARKSDGQLDDALEASIQEQLAKVQPSRQATLEQGPSLSWPTGEFSVARGCMISVDDDGSVSTCSEEHACHLFDCSYLRALVAALEIIQHVKPLPAMQFIVSAADEIVEHDLKQVPVFTRVGTRWTSSLALPAEWQLNPTQCGKIIKVGMISLEKDSWEEREPVLIWRGSPSNLWIPGCSMALAAKDESMLKKCTEMPAGEVRAPVWNFTTWLQLPRGRLVSLSRFFPFIDAKFVRNSNIPMAPDLEQFLHDEGLFSDKMEPSFQARYKYQIAIEGNSAPDRICWQLFLGSVVLVPDSPWQVISVLSLMKPFVHYVPILYDLSDLVERLDWLREHDDEAKQIAHNGAAFAQRYLTCDSNIYYLDRLLRSYASSIVD
eukprot:TRINITY_DN10396_c0_g2_i1.p1 TRINITY_DN10396_c0_g2~~TRINITY_DN10396_c0_g2_i1.p1  ORF type:complete len:569 (+),score=76.91 TRINITY_DN10396_c0_g2_i1:31-1707(+)